MPVTLQRAQRCCLTAFSAVAPAAPTNSALMGCCCGRQAALQTTLTRKAALPGPAMKGFAWLLRHQEAGAVAQGLPAWALQASGVLGVQAAWVAAAAAVAAWQPAQATKAWQGMPAAWAAAAGEEALSGQLTRLQRPTLGAWVAVAEAAWGLPVTQYVLGAGAPQEAGAVPQAPQQAAALQAVSASVHSISLFTLSVRLRLHGKTSEDDIIQCAIALT